ncbi:MAG: hypothetical protein PHU44_08915 [Syntrophales bacterium]|nr:hypothetical protein [Syntrophales bacterium]MDD5642750.1 hypothetical protein [Syntrophales bacterium]
MRPWPIVLGLLLLAGLSFGALAAGKKAADLRQAQGLTPFIPPAKFLAGNFVAEEMNPVFIFGTVKDFAASRKCATAWLIDNDAKERADKAREYTLYLEEDCPDKVVYYVFMDQSNLTPQQWIEWRRRFHKSKTDPQYGATKAKLEHALQDGYGVSGELRFLQKDGELMNKSPEEYLRADLQFVPIYDLNQQKKISK